MATVVGLFDSSAQAQSAIEQFRAAGVPSEHISLAMQDRSEAAAVAEETGVGTGVATGAVGGGILGGLAGLLVGIGALAIPGIGPLVAAGPLAATLLGAGIGAATGGLIGALVGAGVPEEEAQLYQTGVERGGVLVSVQTDAVDDAQVRSILGNAGMRDVHADAAQWKANPDYRYGQGDTGSGGAEAAGGAGGAVAGGLIGGAVAGPIGAVAGAAIGGAAGAGAGTWPRSRTTTSRWAGSRGRRGRADRRGRWLGRRPGRHSCRRRRRRGRGRRARRGRPGLRANRGHG